MTSLNRDTTSEKDWEKELLDLFLEEENHHLHLIGGSNTLTDFISNLLEEKEEETRRETLNECLGKLEDCVGSGLRLDPLSFIHIGGRKDIYEVALMGKVGDESMVIPYNLFKVAIEKVVGEQVSKALHSLSAAGNKK